MLNCIFTSILILSVSVNYFAQEGLFNNAVVTNNKHVHLTQSTFDVDFQSVFLLGEFKKHYKKKSIIGGGFTLLFPINPTKTIFLGFGFGYYVMGHVKPNYVYVDDFQESFRVSSRALNSMIPFHIVSRMYSPKKLNSKIQPYVEVLAGLRMITMDDKISVDKVSTGERVHFGTTTETTMSWSYGMGIGSKLKLSKSDLLYLNSKFTYLYGTSTDYQNPEIIGAYNEGIHEYHSYNSRTDVLRFSIGLYLLLD